MSVKLFSIKISTGKFESITNEIISLAENNVSAYVSVANVHMLIEANRDSKFAEIVNGSDLVVPDGMPLVWAMRLLHGIRQDRVAGMDLVMRLLEKANSKNSNVPVFFYGTTQDVLNKLSNRVHTSFPELNIAGTYSPPFRELTQEENNNVINLINRSNAKIVFVALGCPKQERWMADMKGKINSVMIGVGGAIPVIAGLKRTTPKWMQDNGLEWIFRLSQEPKRLFWRYFKTNPAFVYIFLKAYLNKKLLGKHL